MTSKKIMILCTGNTCRSPMAEGILERLKKEHQLDHLIVESRGFSAYEGDPPTARAIEAMAEIGIDISEKRSKRLTQEDLAGVDIIYVMTPSHQHILLETMPELEPKITILDIADPYMHKLDVYRLCRDQMVGFFAGELPRFRA